MLLRVKALLDVYDGVRFVEVSMDRGIEEVFYLFWVRKGKGEGRELAKGFREDIINSDVGFY